MNAHAKTVLPEEELARRRKALERAAAANRLEGVSASAEVRAIMAEWARGHLTDDEMDARVYEEVVKRVSAKQGEAAG